MFSRSVRLVPHSRVSTLARCRGFRTSVAIKHASTHFRVPRNVAIGSVIGVALALGSTVATSESAEGSHFRFGMALGSSEAMHAWLRKHPQVTLLEDPSNPIGASVIALLTRMRDRDCSHEDFVGSLDRIMGVLVEATLGHFATKEVQVNTPMGDRFTGLDWSKDFAAVSILRSGDAMLKGFTKAIPSLLTGSVLISRDRTKAEKPHVVYYSKIPKDLDGRQVMLMDPMLASGITAELAIQVLVEHGVKEEDVTLVHLIVTTEGIEHISKSFPKVRIVAASLDSGIDETSKYIVPGVGCFGDRYFSAGV